MCVKRVTLCFSFNDRACVLFPLVPGKLKGENLEAICRGSCSESVQCHFLTHYRECQRCEVFSAGSYLSL